jgi:hypothetical protein
MLSARELPVAGRTPLLCSAATVTEHSLELLAEAGLPIDATLVRRFADATEYADLLDELAHSSARLVIHHVHAPDELEAERYWIPRELLCRLNNKASLTDLVPADLVPERRLSRPDALPPAERLLAHGPVVLKVATDQSTGGGLDVWVCHRADDVDAARIALRDAELVVIERHLDIRRNLCVQFAAAADGQVHFLGAAEQVSDPRGGYQGNWLEGDLAAPAEMIAAGTAIMRQAAALGYRGFAGFDMATCGDGTTKVFDLNFRVNGSTAGLLLHADLARTRAAPVARYRVWHGNGDFAALLATARNAVRRGTLVPLATYDPAADSAAGARPALAGLLLGASRDEIRRHEAELAQSGLG